MELHPRRKHHTVPKHYLKGFTSKENPTSVWVFTKGRKYIPGIQHQNMFSPCLTSIRIADTEMDFYANEIIDNKGDFDSVEKKLEQLEKPCQPILDKIRNIEVINEEEKWILSEYIILTYRRVRHFRSDPNNLYEKTMKEVFGRMCDEINHALSFYRNDPDQLTGVKLIEAELDRIHNKYKNEKPVLLKKMLNELLFESFEKMTKGLYNMHWAFGIKRFESSFITSDNPVYFSRMAGISRSDLSFPISKDIALVASWEPLFKQQYQMAPEQIVRQINKRTVSLATKYVFSSTKDRWVNDDYRSR